MKDAATKTGLIVGTGALWSVGSLVVEIAVWIPFRWHPAMWSLVTAPMIEEVMRYGAATTLMWRADLRTAAAIGLVGGMLEVGAKYLQYGADVALLTSLPIHIALSIVFYTSRRWRVPTSFLAHSLLNLILGTLASFRGVSVYTILLTALAVSTLMVVIARWASAKMEERQP